MTDWWVPVTDPPPEPTVPSVFNAEVSLLWQERPESGCVGRKVFLWLHPANIGVGGLDARGRLTVASSW